MRHLKIRRRLGRATSHRVSMLRNMVTDLLRHERIRTTDAKAKELRKVADKIITLGKKGTLHARRKALEILRSKDVAKKLFDEIANKFQKRSGGYTRIIKLGRRAGDAAPMSIIELLSIDKDKKKKEKKQVSKKAKDKKEKE